MKNSATPVSDDPRHVPNSVVDDYFSKNIAGVFRIDGAPRAELIVDPPSRVIGLRVQELGRAPAVTQFENIAFDAQLDGDTLWHRILVRVDDNLEEAYAFVRSILDRIQIEKAEFAVAVEEAVESLIGILALRRTLSKEKQVGLFGELLILRAVQRRDGTEAALKSWRGARGEEHDFGLSQLDLEVKTTTGERRIHWISGANQLVPTPGRPLVLASVQLTTAGSQAGRTLSTLVEETKARFHSKLSIVTGQLNSVGYHDVDADLYPTRWVLRSIPEFYEVGPSFPAITLGRLQTVVPGAERIQEVRYSVDVTGLEHFPLGLRFDEELEID